MKARRDAVPLHDIDHILTEYKTDWLGEWEISSYELGTGCGRYWAATLINMQAILVGALRAPRLCIKAFARGRRSKGVYHFSSVDELLNQNLGSLRQLTTSSAENIKTSFLDKVLFFLWLFASVALHISPLLIVAWGLLRVFG